MNAVSSVVKAILARVRQWLRESHPAKIVAVGYLMHILVGWVLLSLPFMTTAPVSSLDNLFTVTSAVSTTGLVTTDVGSSYSFWGQLLVLVLIQIGGLGYMTFGSFVLLCRDSEMSPRRQAIERSIFSVPESFRIEKFIPSVVGFAAIIECLGAVALFGVFRSQGVAMPLWQAVFHSVSAFCTAGFSLFSTGFTGFAGSFWVNVIVAVLSYLGAIGFIVCVDYWRKLRGKVAEVTLTSRIIIWSTAWLSVIGTLLILALEPSLFTHPIESRLMESAFQAMSALTTVGFNTVDIGALSNATLLLIIMLMIIGASPAGTGGGLKSTTFTALFGVMRSALKGHHEVTFWGRRVPARRLRQAMAGLVFYVTALVTGTYLLELTQKSSFAGNLFEAASALGTVGLSTGITAGLTSLGKLIVIVLMYCGRLGPLTFGLALFYRAPEREDASDSDLAV